MASILKEVFKGEWTNKQRSKLKCNLPWKQLAVGLVVLILLLDRIKEVQAAKKNNPDCSVCKDVSMNFDLGLLKTKKSGHGGGNTNWEEGSLKSFSKSEVRLVEIMDEYLCKGGSKACHALREKYEEVIEDFWFNVFAQDESTDFHKWFCIDKIMACCEENNFGSECKPCLVDPDRPCFGNGHCDGMGTREGNGKCRCNIEYKGEKCNECADGYIEEHRNETHTVCKQKEKPKVESKEKKKLAANRNYDNKRAPYFWTFLSILAGYAICVKYSRGNMFIIIPITVIMSVFVYWYASFFK